MRTVIFLRMLFDLSFYFTFSGLLVSGLFGMRGSAWCAAAAPAVLYVIRLILRKRLLPDYGQCADRLVIYVRIWIPLSLILLLCGAGETVRMVLLPFGALTAFSGTLLLRLLRHSPEVYENAAFQLKNALPLSLPVLAAFLFSGDRAQTLAAKLFGLFFDRVWIPVMELLLNALFLVFSFLGRVLSMILPDFHFPEHEQTPLQLSGGSGEELFSELQGAAEHPYLKLVLFTLLILLLFCLAFRFLSWLSGRDAVPQRFGAWEEGKALRPERKQTARIRENGPVRSVRKSYRNYLRYLKRQGCVMPPDFTSAAAAAAGQQHALSPEETEALRDIFRRARYGGTVTDEDARRAAALVRDLTASRQSPQPSARP